MGQGRNGNISKGETTKLPAQLRYKIHVFYMGHTYQSTKVKKSCNFKYQMEYMIPTKMLNSKQGHLTVMTLSISVTMKECPQTLVVIPIPFVQDTST